MDIDEIIDRQYSDFSFTASSNIHNVLFNLVHLWNSEKKYNIEYPFSREGIQCHFRMFRNIGHMQINADKSVLHFKQTPYIKSIYHSRILILHYGNLTKEKRYKSYLFYKNQDKKKDQISYDHLINDTPLLSDVDKIAL